MHGHKIGPMGTYALRFLKTISYLPLHAYQKLWISIPKDFCNKSIQNCNYDITEATGAYARNPVA